jgi:type IV pilus assembly protein PilB
MSELQNRFDTLLTQAGGQKSRWGGAEKTADKNPITSQVVDIILEQAVLDRASDIHIEPEEGENGTGLRVRYRIDGELYPVLSVKDPNLAILPRIKIMAGLATDASGKRKSQDGRFNLHLGASNYDFRLSTFPVVNGEKMAIRILSETVGQMKLESMGLEAQDLARLSKLMQYKHGLLLVTGPTGSGKTSTLYALINKVNSPKINIITLEDPVEYQIPGLNQCDIKTKSDFSFAEGLKAILRQDPNIILVGEMRDRETSEIALRASMTGHLVISSLHANSAIGTIARLINMGLDPYMVSYALIGAVAQRLVRQICDQCRLAYTLTPEQVNRLRNAYGVNVELLTGRRDKAASSEGGMTYEDAAAEAAGTGGPQVVVYKGAGCHYCRGTGYRGRLGIFEIVVFEDELREAIVRGASGAELTAIAVRHGTRRLAVDALDKVRKGLTTFEEVGPILLEK